MIEQMLYCGQRDRVGHYVWPSYGDTSRSYLRLRQLAPDAPFEWLDDDKWQPKGRREGAAKLTHIDGWTVLGFHDYSIDTRPGNHSTFAAKGIFTAEEMEREARRLFPDVWARFKFTVTVTEVASIG